MPRVELLTLYERRAEFRARSYRQPLPSGSSAALRATGFHAGRVNTVHSHQPENLRSVRVLRISSFASIIDTCVILSQGFCIALCAESEEVDYNIMKNNQKTRGPSPQKTEKTRASIVEAARDEFITFGYSAGKTDRICKSAGVSRGTLYCYFPTKESLFESVLQEFITAARAELLAQQRKPGEKVKDFLCRALLPVMATIETSNRAQIARLVILESAQFPALAQAYVREIYQPLLEEFKRFINLAIEEGELKNDRLAKFPQLLLAPNWMGMVFNGMLSPSEPMDIAAMFEANIQLLFGE